MSATPPDPAALAALQERFRGLPLECGKPDDPGIEERGEWSDWADHKTTPDQLRIEDYLDGFDLTGRTILHVGCGNSGLAARFAGRARRIVGTTVTPGELSYAQGWIESSDVRNYQVLLHNKYLGREGVGDETFDFIIDNNPSTFGCCLTHFSRMMEFYAGALAPGGQIVTERVGLGWAMPHSHPRWGFDAADLDAFARLFGLGTHEIGANVIVLARGKPRRPSIVARIARFLRKISRRIGGPGA